MSTFCPMYSLVAAGTKKYKCKGMLELKNVKLFEWEIENNNNKKRTGIINIPKKYRT